MSPSPAANRPWRKGPKFNRGAGMQNCRTTNRASTTASAPMKTSDGPTVRVTSFNP